MIPNHTYTRDLSIISADYLVFQSGYSKNSNQAEFVNLPPPPNVFFFFWNNDEIWLEIVSKESLSTGDCYLQHSWHKNHLGGFAKKAELQTPQMPIPNIWSEAHGSDF